VRVNVDAHLGHEEGDAYKNRTKQAHLPRERTKTNFEYESIEHGLKWWPIKSYEVCSTKELEGLKYPPLSSRDKTLHLTPRATGSGYEHTQAKLLARTLAR
jgi:hypothetical protein